jgi:ribose 5-phosphate isomerase A
MAAVSGVEAAKKRAAFRAVDEHIKEGMRVGVGSGSTIVYAVERLVELHTERGWNFRCVPTSFQAKQLIVDGGLTLTDLTETPELDVAIDGADEVDEGLNCIKGGGGCQTQEKIVASAAPKLVIVADYRKQSKALGTQWKKGVPIEVIPMAYRLVSRRLEELGGNPKLRMAVAKAGPVVTDSGNFILDADFGEIARPAELDARLQAIPGVVETGLFCGMAKAAYFGQDDGSVVHVEPK